MNASWQGRALIVAAAWNLLDLGDPVLFAFIAFANLVPHQSTRPVAA